MARITFSPLIVEASGKVKDTVFARWKGRPYIRARVTPANPKSADQTKQRNIMTAAVAFWQSMHADLVAAFNTYGTAYRLSGYNVSTRRNAATAAPNGDGTYARMESAGTYFPALMQPTPGSIDLTTVAAVTGAGASGTIDVSWAAGAWQATDYVYVVALNAQGTYLIGTPETAISKTAANAAAVTSAGLTATEAYNVGVIVHDVTNDTWGTNQGDTLVTAKA